METRGTRWTILKRGSTTIHASAPSSNGDPSLSVTPFSGSAAEWDAVVGTLEGSTFCHLAGWRPVMEDALGHEAWWWSAVDEAGACHGVLPLVRVKSLLFGDYLLSMPFLSYGGPIGSEAARGALAEHAVAEAGRLGVDLLELRDRRPVPGELATSERKITVLKALPDSTDALWEDGLKAKVRSQVRKPMKEGLEARTGPDFVDAFYDIFAVTMRDLGTPVLPKRFFEALGEHLGEHLIYCVVEHEGTPVAAGCGFLWNGEFEITWAGALREYNRMAPNMLLYWALMEESVRRGADTFNFGRCTPGSGTHRFKKQWGTEDHPLPWAQWSPDGVAATPNPESAKFRLATQVWQKLPVGVTNAVGPVLARSLP
ncbi:MAG: FemAB family XrtA/PEP-CTERM system-associated protein [Gemmatimonadota bacterium]|nr:FemAB family XrtA/PEP-CTERM system-associated protein [Gemmatimonadota bacterium]